MTDLMVLAKRLFKKVEYQETPEEVTIEDLVDHIQDAVRMLYVISGRSLIFSEDKFSRDDEFGVCVLSDDLKLDEQEWVMLQAQIEFYKKVQAGHDDDVSYTTDAMSVTHGDKPYEHIGQSIDRLEAERNVVWARMVRYNQLGVSE